MFWIHCIFGSIGLLLTSDTLFFLKSHLAMYLCRTKMSLKLFFFLQYVLTNSFTRSHFIITDNSTILVSNNFTSCITGEKIRHLYSRWRTITIRTQAKLPLSVSGWCTSYPQILIQLRELLPRLVSLHNPLLSLTLFIPALPCRLTWPSVYPGLICSLHPTYWNGPPPC